MNLQFPRCGFLHRGNLRAGAFCRENGAKIGKTARIFLASIAIQSQKCYADKEVTGRGYAKARGKLITCDPNLRLPLWKSEEAAKEQMLWSLHQADVVKISDNEVEFLWNCTPEEGADKLLSEFGVSLAMVTLGPDGCLLKTKNASFRAACPKVHPIDTTGAGDIFGGSAVSRLLELEKPIDALTEADLAYIGCFAATAASLSTEASGGIPSIPKKSAVLKAI